MSPGILSLHPDCACHVISRLKLLPIRMGSTFELRTRITPSFLSWCIFIPATEKVRQIPRVHCPGALTTIYIWEPCNLNSAETKFRALNSDPDCHLISVSSLHHSIFFCLFAFKCCSHYMHVSHLSLLMVSNT